LVTGYNFITGTTNTTDANGHGTNVAGIIGAVGNNGIGVAGLDWNVEIMPLVFLDSSGSGLLSNAVAAVNYAVAAGAKIINNSWGGGGYDAAMESAIQNAQAHGVIFVAAAGNNSSDNDTTPEYPASYTGSNVVSVEATDQNNNLASFSDYGTSVSIAAPGVSILSTGLNNTYSYYSGTSQATPFVTGALALVWSIEPTWTYSQVIADVLNNTDKIASLTGKVETGLLDVGKAVAAAEAALPKAPSPTQPAPITSSGVTTVSSGNVNLAVPALQTTTSTITVNQNISISNLTVTVNLKDTYDSAVNISLVSPSGQTILLFNHRGGAGQNLTNTTFSDSSPNAIYLAAAPFSESVRPEYSLSPLTNTNAYGTWKLVITDIAKGTSATLVNWSLNITAATSSTAGRTTSVAGEFFGTLAQTPPADAANSQAAANSSAAAWLFAPSNAIVISNSGSAGSSAPKWSKSDSPNWSISFVDRPGFTPFAGDDDFGNESPDWAE
jgi:subtilisin-like proprotein convertase family protein